MSALLFALALVSAQEPATAVETSAPIVQAVTPAEAPTTPDAPTPRIDQAPEPPVVAQAKVEELPFPIGAPTDDFGLVAWCYGALGGYLDLHDRVLPEVSRIEGAYRRPGTTLAVLQARFDSSRLPGKALLPIGKIPMVVLAAKRIMRNGMDLVVATSVASPDDAIVQTALSAKVDYLVTADQEILKRKKVGNVAIITAAEFARLLGWSPE